MRTRHDQLVIAVYKTCLIWGAVFFALGLVREKLPQELNFLLPFARDNLLGAGLLVLLGAIPLRIFVLMAFDLYHHKLKQALLSLFSLLFLAASLLLYYLRPL